MKKIFEYIEDQLEPLIFVVACCVGFLLVKFSESKQTNKEEFIKKNRKEK